ncbi:MAG: 1,4-alpha-glucan branching protein [Deltaproteobacteria bacterium HGW-Deltaproteobacteria-14]|nr:MAG: 1,4-alpha-glucan branching protein [Deltaproteobacteria bacterium HGW-Deltaproteobacteria-14]
MISKRHFKTKDEVEVTFELDAADASEAELFCAALDWKPEPMKRSDKGGPFRLKLRLPKDQQIEFRYLVDHAEWRNEPGADGQAPNSFGTVNSVVSTTA